MAFQIRMRQTSAGTVYDIVNTDTGLPVVTWWSGDYRNEMTGFRDVRRAEMDVEQLQKGWLRDVRPARRC